MIPITSTGLHLGFMVLDPWTYVWGGLLLLVTLLGVFVINLVNRWRQKPESASLSPSDQLSQYRSMFEAGTLSKEEFEQLRAVLAVRLRSDLEMPPTGPSASATPKMPTSPGPPPGPDEPPASEGIRPA